MRYETPVGSFDNWESAAQACEACDMDATLCVTVHEDETLTKGRKVVEISGLYADTYTVLDDGRRCHNGRRKLSSPSGLVSSMESDGWTLERAPAVEPSPQTFESNSGEQLTMFAKGSDWKPRHRDLFDVEAL